MRTTRKFRRYDHAFREDAVALLHRSEKTVREVADSLGMPRMTLYSWLRNDMTKKSKKGLAGRKPAPTAGGPAETDAEKLVRLEAENEALRKKVASLEEDKDILKKFAAFSVREKT